MTGGQRTLPRGYFPLRPPAFGPARTCDWSPYSRYTKGEAVKLDHYIESCYNYDYNYGLEIDYTQSDAEKGNNCFYLDPSLPHLYCVNMT